MSKKLFFKKENDNLTYFDAEENAKISVNIHSHKFKVENPNSKRVKWVSPRHAAIAFMMLQEIEKQIAKAKETNEVIQKEN